jgi:hypothetical protein
MSDTQRFTAIIEDAGDGGAYVSIPFDVEKVYGKKRVKIKASIDGEPYRGTLVRMGAPQHILIVLKEIRQKIGKSVGDEVTIELEEDLEPRVIDVPADLQEALDTNPPAKNYFNSLSYTHQKEYIRWITEAKRDETRLKRIQQTIALLMKGKSGH